MTEFTFSQTAASNANADASINWAEGQSPGSVNNSARAMMAARAKARDDLAGVRPSNAVITTGGTTTAYTVTSNQTLTALTNGFSVTFRINATNTGTTTLAVDGLAAKPLRAQTAVELVAGDLLIGHTYTATYFQPTDEWLLKVSPVLARSVSFAQIEEIATDRVLGRDTAGNGSIEELTLGSALVITGGALTITTDGVTFSQIENIATDRVLGRDIAGDGDIEELTLGTGLVITGGALTLSSQNAMVYIETLSPSAVTSVVTTTFSADYHSFLFILKNIEPDTDNAVLLARVEVSASFPTSGYEGDCVYIEADVGAATQDATAGIALTSGVGTAAGDTYVNGQLRICPHGTGRHPIVGQTTYTEPGTHVEVAFPGGRYDTSGAVTRVAFRFDSGLIADGDIIVYGVKAS